MAVPIVAYALIAAVIAATATTAIKEATSGHEDMHDAFGTWLKSFFTSFALSSVAGAAGSGASAGEDAIGASEVGGMWEGIEGELAGAGAGATGAGATTAETAAMMEPVATEYGIGFEQSAVEPLAQTADVSGALGSVDSWFGGNEGFDLTKLVAEKFGVSQPSGWNQYQDVAEGFGGVLGGGEQKNLAQQQLTEYLSKYLSKAGSSWGSPQKTGLVTGLEEDLKKYETKPLTMSSALGGGGNGYEWF